MSIKENKRVQPPAVVNANYTQICNDAVIH